MAYSVAIFTQLTSAIRGRPDTIRCIVANLVGDKESGDSLADVDEPAQPLSQVQMEDYSDPNWEPEPIDAGPDFRTNKPSDTISTLVSIYDSKDLFVKELQVLLAQRLLAIQDGNFDNEVRFSPLGFGLLLSLFFVDLSRGGCSGGISRS